MLLRNHWYAAGFPDEFGRALKPRTYLNENVVIYRTQSGEPVALEDRCAHRRLPLSMGRLVDDSVQCLYHGLVYDCTGSCVRIPGQKTVPKGVNVRRYPIVDKYCFTWIWIGDPDLADESLIPDYGRLDDPAWAKSRIQFHLECHYQLIVDNLMDLSHLAYVHNTTTGNDAMAEDAVVRSECKDDVVQVKRWLKNIPAAPTFREFAGYTGNMDSWQLSEFRPPSYVRVSYGSAPAGAPMPRGNQFWSQGHWGFQVFHGITPETEKTSFQFRYVAYQFGDADPDTIEEFRRQCDQIISEDAAIFPIQQRSIDGDPEATLEDINSTVSIVHDGGLSRARRIASRLAALKG